MRTLILLMAATAIVLTPALVRSAAAQPAPERRCRSAETASLARRRIRRRRNRRSRRLCRRRRATGRGSFGDRQFAGSLSVHHVEFGGRKRLRGAGRLCLHHAPADGHNERRGRTRLRAWPRGRPYRRQPPPGAPIRGNAQFDPWRVGRNPRQCGRWKCGRQSCLAGGAAEDLELLARPRISGRRARHPLCDGGGLRSWRRCVDARCADPRHRAQRANPRQDQPLDARMGEHAPVERESRAARAGGGPAHRPGRPGPAQSATRSSPSWRASMSTTIPPRASSKGAASRIPI